nr:site-specific DNA-methyltransferase [Hyphomicrobiales bacterium]
HVNGLGEALVLPSIRPVTLVADALLDSTEPGEIVLDAFCGSGTVLVAAETTGRRARAMGFDPGRCDSSIRRWQAYTGQDAVLAGTGGSFDGVRQERSGP